MDFLKTCNTNAQAVGDFEAVAFQAFSVRRSIPHTAIKANDRAPSEDIRAVEGELKQGLHLVVHDVARPWLWLFRAATVDQVGQQPDVLPVVDGFELQREQFGIMKASELARPPLRSSNPNAPSSATANSPSAPGPLKGSQGGGVRAQEQQSTHDSHAIYELFTSSVVALISYHLVRDHKAIALNFRSFLSNPSNNKIPTKSRDITYIPDVSFWLTNINVYWVSSGSLIVSIYSVAKPEIRSLNHLSTDFTHEQIIGRCVRVSPKGSLAQIVSFDDPMESIAEDIHQRLQRKRVKLHPLEQGIERWKGAVTRWLSWKGYSLLDLEKRTSWVQIRVARASSSPALVNPSQDILWPRALCFFYNDSFVHSLSVTQELSTPQGTGLEWLETLDSDGFRDPLDVAQQWFLGKSERDKILEVRRKAQKAEEDAARSKEEISAGLFPSSPLNSRTAMYGDLQAVSGVYPTPPDGVPPGVALSSGDTASISGAAANTILAPGGGNPAINLSVPLDKIIPDDFQQEATSPDLPVPFDPFNSSGGNDDLFEDMDEDGYGNGVTDADFNFFDGPDGDDIDMLDLPTQSSKTVSNKKAGKDANQLPMPELEIKEEMSDPMAALENALATASGPVEATLEVQTQKHKDEVMQEKEASKHISRSHQERLGMQPVAPFLKEATPPLSPHHIEHNVLPYPESKPSQQMPKDIKGHRDSIFNPVLFNHKMNISDAKYKDGRFSFKAESKEDHEPAEVPKRSTSLRNLPLLSKLRYAIGIASTNGIFHGSESLHTDSDFSNDTSPDSSVRGDDIDDEVSIPPEPLSASLVFAGKRKLPTEGNATPLSTTSFADSFSGDVPDVTGLQSDESYLASLEPLLWDWSLIHMPNPVEVRSSIGRYSVPVFSTVTTSIPNTPTTQPERSPEVPDEKPLSGKDTIAVAQIITEQIAFATLDILGESSSYADEFTSGRSFPDARLRTVVRDIFPKSSDCNVLGLISVQDVFPDLPQQAKGQQRPPPRRPNEAPALPGHHVYQISPPHVRIRRADALWDLLPPALTFWEALGLSPCSPPKSVVPFCIYPQSESLRPYMESFMLNMQIAYESCKLGTHVKTEIIPEFRGGLVPYKISTPASTRAAFKSLRETCVMLGKLFAAKYAQMNEKDEQKIDAIVIYMVDPFEKASAVWEFCSAFWSLFQAYGQSPSSRQDLATKPDLVLQLIPMRYIASPDVPKVLDSSTFITLAREVYDRCPPSSPSDDKTPLAIYTAPSVQLEEAIPRAIPFKLNSDVPQDLLRENSYIHLGYAISLDGAWVTAAWTDSCGKSQAVVSYNLGTRAFGEIAREIWQTTIEILSARRVTWRVCIAKSGVMEREEFETWVFLASCPTQLNLFITLLAVDTNPTLKFTPTIASQSAPSTNAQGSMNTPGSTPQPGVSPDPHGLTPAATPSAEPATDPSADPDARLVDLTDESWGIILSHRIHNTYSTTEFRPSLISGLLIKRGTAATIHPQFESENRIQSASSEPGPIIVGVNILWVGMINSTRAASSPFPPSPSPTSVGAENLSPSPSPVQERSSTSLMWTPTAQTRATAENLLKEVLGQYRALGLLARLKGVKDTRGGAIPWHIAVAERGVKGLGKCFPP